MQNFDLYVKALLSRKVVPETYLEPGRTSMMELFCENSNPFTIFAKSSILDARLGSKDASEFTHQYKTFSKYLSKV